MGKRNNIVKTVLANIDVIIASSVLTILIILTFLGVLWRYVFQAPFTWLEEVQLACIVWIVFAAAGAAFRTGSHVAIEMVVDLLPENVQKVMNVVISIIVVCVVGYLFYNSIGFIQMMIKNGRSTSMLHIPYMIIYAIALVSYVDMLISYFYGLKIGAKSEAKEAAEGNE